MKTSIIYRNCDTCEKDGYFDVIATYRNEDDENDTVYKIECRYCDSTQVVSGIGNTVESSIWTHFHDAHTNGYMKTEYDDIYIEAPESDAVSVFYARFGRNPRKVTCTCCGTDFGVSETDNLPETYWTVYRDGKSCFIPASEITDDERQTPVPQQGYVWTG